MITAKEAKTMWQDIQKKKSEEKKKNMEKERQKAIRRFPNLLLVAEKEIKKAIEHNEISAMFGKNWVMEEIDLCHSELKRLGFKVGIIYTGSNCSPAIVVDLRFGD